MVPQPSARIKAEMNQLRLVDGAELLHELLGASHDGLATGLEHLAGVEALALEVLAGLDVLTGSSSEDELQVGVHVDLGKAKANETSPKMSTTVRGSTRYHRRKEPRLFISLLPISQLNAPVLKPKVERSEKRIICN